MKKFIGLMIIPILMVAYGIGFFQQKGDVDSANSMADNSVKNEQVNVNKNTQNIDLLNVQLAQLEMQLGILAKQLANSSNTITTVGVSDVDNLQNLNEEKMTSSYVNDLERNYQSKLDMQQQIQKMDMHFQAQSIEQAWTQETEADLQAILSLPGMSTHVIQDVECRGSLCKFDIFGEQSTEYADGLPIELSAKIADILPAGEMVANESGGLTVYLARSAEDLHNNMARSF